MARLPFEITSHQGHLITGLLFLEEAFLVFEIRVVKWGIQKQPTETVKVEFGALDHVRFDRGFFKDHIYVVPKRSALLEAIPGSHKGEIQLHIAKRYREQALALVAEVRARQATSL